MMQSAFRTTMVAIIAATAVTSISTFVLMAYVSHKLVGGTLVCEPPEGLVMQWHRKHMENHNKGYTDARN